MTIQKNKPGPDADQDFESSDIAYQSSQTASIISLNSACRRGSESEDKDLKTLTQLLFLGFTDVQIQEEKPVKLQGIDGLETTLTGKLNDEEMKLRTVVFKREGCLFDMIYLARPRHFQHSEDMFSQFVASLKVK